GARRRDGADGARPHAFVHRRRGRARYGDAGALLYALGDALLRAGVRAARRHGRVSPRATARIAARTGEVSGDTRRVADRARGHDRSLRLDGAHRTGTSVL